MLNRLKPNFKLKLEAGFLLALILTFLVNLLNYKASEDFILSSNHIQSTFKVLMLKKDIENNLLKLESQSRVYAISGNAEFISEYELIKKKILNALEELAALGENKKANIFREKAGPLVTEKINFTDEIIELTKADKSEEALALIASGKGIAIMEKIQQGAGRIAEEEYQILTEQSLHNEERGIFVNFANIMFFIFTLLLVIFGGFFIMNEHNKSAILNREMSFRQKQLFTFLDKVPMGILVLDKKLKVVFVNSITESLLGHRIKPGISLSKLIKALKVTNDQNNPAVLFEVRAVNALKGIPQHFDDIKMTLNKKEIFLEIFANPIFDDSGNVEFAICVYKDVSQSKETERALKSAKELSDSLLEAKENFIANISHEIRTPMNSILGFADLLEKSKLSGEQLDYTRTIKNSGEILLAIINDVLDYSKMESGLMHFESKPFSIGAVLDNLYSLLCNSAKEKGIDLFIDSDDKLPDFVSGDSTRLMQILINLTGNAIKFTDKGFVKITSKLVNHFGNSVTAEFKVIDSGIGIPESKTEDIFNRFNQVYNDTDRKYGGTGLGLSIVKNLVELQGGTIIVESVESVGSVFCFTLTFKAFEQTEIQFPSDQKVVHSFVSSGKKVLLTEDNQMNRKLALAMLKPFDLNIETAVNGIEAVEAVKRNDYDLILMDIQMPEMDGYTATQIIRNELKSTIPIVAMTAHALPGEKERCLDYGMNDYVSKPIKEQDLFEKLERYLSAEKKSSNALAGNITLKTSSIDLSFLEEMSFSKPEFIKDILSTFINESANNRIKLRESFNSKDFPSLKLSAHTLKSNVAYLGLKNLAEKLKEIETNASNNKLIDDLNFKEVEAHLEQAVSEAKEKLNHMG
jgi:signal transduction histidine kinase/CheY-like chemotaxis protein/CHASE3 domain sensor protein/HPt (histidine-containing phosphotransfer) domain-containing protein